ncbi:MAG TPA: alpha-isopropylmalate synthase regulatory domain-containing protein [Candidatus Limnocylindrales bacterium]|nr:alpha-isopropylmalate synthase regulatory domain-containing protein [Candidatus Limnocylindrales bacterium]
MRKVYDGGVLKVITATELARNLDPVLDALEERGTTVIVRRHDQPQALLLRFDAYVAMLATMDYSGWERWIEEVRAAFPQAVLAPPRLPKAIAPAFVDAADLGYDPALGQVGTQAGRRRFADELAALGVPIGEEDLTAAYALVLNLAERKRVLYPEDLKLAAYEALGRRAGGRFTLDQFQMHLHSGMDCTAEVQVQDGEQLRPGTARGSGPLDAGFRAIAAATGIAPELEDFSLAAATRGSDALGEAVVTLSQGSAVVVGRAVSVDVVEAALNAYVNALNWLIRAGHDLEGAFRTA